jgi:phosphate transport system permease protein
MATAIGILTLAILLIQVLFQGIGWLDWDFIISFPSRFPGKAGILPALVGTLWLMGLTALFSFPIGVGTALYLEEYAAKNRLTAIIQTNVANLAGVPSIVYGILGLAIFVRTLALERSIVSGALTMTLLILPVIIIASQEAIKAVPDSLRQASYALGATRWQTVRRVVLPISFPGILTGTILALSRAMGETAPLITIGALTAVWFIPSSPLDQFTALPIQIFNWASRPQADFRNIAAAAIIVLLVVLLSFNALAILLRARYRTKR